MDKKRSRVLFAEANKDFVDILFSFLTLPLGTIVRLLNEHSYPEPVKIGSLSTLYESVANLEVEHFRTGLSKDTLLNPKNSSEALCSRLKINIEPTKYFVCAGKFSSVVILTEGVNDHSFSTYRNARCRLCGQPTSREIGLDNSKGRSGDDEGVFVNQRTSFIFTDDLLVMPKSLGTSVLELLKNFGISDLGAVEEMTLNVGMVEILNLLKWSLLSKSPLTNLVYQKEAVKEESNLSNASASQQQEICKETRSSDKKMTVKVMIQKSSNKLLFVQAEEDFIEFLFSFLTIPLGRVISLLGGNSSLCSIDNLFKSISICSNRYLKSPDILLRPKLAPNHGCSSQILPIDEASMPIFRCHKRRVGQLDNWFLTSTNYSNYSNSDDLSCADPKNDGYVEGPAMFFVTDALVVTPLSSISIISALRSAKMSLNDVEEKAVIIGLEEALSILKALLNSTSALTDGLNPFLK